jgi:hypothetical protein
MSFPQAICSLSVPQPPMRRVVWRAFEGEVCLKRQVRRADRWLDLSSPHPVRTIRAYLTYGAVWSVGYRSPTALLLKFAAKEESMSAIDKNGGKRWDLPAWVSGGYARRWSSALRFQRGPRCFLQSRFHVEPSLDGHIPYEPPPVVMCLHCLSTFSADGLDQCPGCGAPDWEWRTVSGIPDRA